MICRNECLSYGFNKPLAQGSGKLKEGLEEVQAQHWPTCCQIGAVCELQQHLYLCCCCQVASVVFNSVRPHRQQPTRLPCPWDSPGKNTGVGCHFLLQCMKVKSESEVTQLCLTLCDPMDWSLPGSSIHGIFQARVLEC